MQEVTVDINLWVECPKCTEIFDLMDIDHDNDHICTKAAFSNEWDSLKGEEFQCPCCGNDFTIDTPEH